MGQNRLDCYNNSTLMFKDFICASTSLWYINQSYKFVASLFGIAYLTKTNVV